jgi:hypothetical protein
LIDTSNIYKRRDKYQAIGGEKFVRAAESVMKVVVFSRLLLSGPFQNCANRPFLPMPKITVGPTHSKVGGLFPLRPRQNAPKEHQTWRVTLTL